MNRNMKAITWAMEVRGLEPGPWRVLMVLCGHVNKRDYEVWPSFRTIVEKAEISRDSAKRYVALLVDHGFIELVGAMWRETGGRSTNKYRICVDQIDVSHADDEEEDDYTPQADPRGNLHRGQGQSSAPGARGTAAPSKEPLKERTSQLEDSPLSFGEPPPGDEAGSILPAVVDQPMFALIPDAEPEPDLIEYVKAEWAKLSADHPRIANPRVWNDARTKKIRARAMDVVRDSDEPITPFHVWDQIFAAIRGSEWLRGDSAPSRGYSESFVVHLDFVLRQSEFFKILEKAPIDAERNRTIPTVNGRQLSGSEQAAYRAIQRQIARRKQQPS